MKNMLNETNKQKRFWALKNNSVSIKNALSMHEGDRVIFLFYRLTPCNPSERYKISHPPPLDTKINIHGYIIGKITTGHHFMINQQNPENKETFFEAVGVNVGDRNGLIFSILKYMRFVQSLMAASYYAIIMSLSFGM